MTIERVVADLFLSKDLGLERNSGTGRFLTSSIGVEQGCQSLLQTERARAGRSGRALELAKRLVPAVRRGATAAVRASTTTTAVRASTTTTTTTASTAAATPTPAAIAATRCGVGTRRSGIATARGGVCPRRRVRERGQIG